jgi:hypothetical protein
MESLSAGSGSDDDFERHAGTESRVLQLAQKFIGEDFSKFRIRAFARAVIQVSLSGPGKPV